MKPLTTFLVIVLIVAVAAGIIIRLWPDAGSGDNASGVAGGPTPPVVEPVDPPPPDAITISMASSITKWEWLEAAAHTFNTASPSDRNLQVNGKPVYVEILLEEDPLNPGKFKHWLSPTQVKATRDREIEPTILSPAASTWILWLNKEWRQRHGQEITSGVGPSLLSTPVVIAMWESRARALGCWPDPQPECTWGRIRNLAASPEGWGMVGRPEWGMFRFGYAYVGESDVATQTAGLLCMSGLQKTADLTPDDVDADNACGQAIADVDRTIVHRGTSSPWLLGQMQTGGPEYLDAVTTYEKNVVGFNLQNGQNLREPLVAVYPQDGTVVADHTFTIMDRAPWVTEEQVAAARVFQQFLLSPAQQEAFLPFGLRSSDPNVPLSDIITAANGAIPSKDLVTLEVPDTLVVDLIVGIWRDVKKHANVVLVFDKSGSMQGEKIDQAVNGAETFVKAMDNNDWLFWLPFDSRLYPGVQGLKFEIGEEIGRDIRSTRANGGTALYDTIAHAYQLLEEQRSIEGDTVRYGIVVLSDGQDAGGGIGLARLEAMLRPSESDPFGIQIHTIGIGNDADADILRKIANITHGKYWEVNDPATIDAVYRLISKYW
ncbi:MAG: VWA domain-containing protein [Dehalococcoidia bacterium]